jgi:hypothetical protein
MTIQIDGCYSSVSQYL